MLTIFLLDELKSPEESYEDTDFDSNHIAILLEKNYWYRYLIDNPLNRKIINICSLVYDPRIKT